MSNVVPMYGFGGGGGALLNFKVIPNPQPETAKENTIWVETDKINNYYFSAEQPENMVDYDVWFPMDTASPVEFNALRKNGIQVFPGSAKQYVDGAWSSKAASIFQNGEWIQFSYDRVYLFKSGEGALAELKTYDESRSTVSVGVDSIEIDYSDTGEYYVVSVRTAEKISMSGYTSLCMEYTSSQRNSSKYASFGVTSTVITKADTSITWASKTTISVSSSRKTLTVDLTTVSEALYVAVNFGGQMSIYNMWLE